MKLKEWLFRNNKKITALAREIGVSRGALNRIVNGKISCGAKTAKKIEAGTKGEVTIRDMLYPEEEGNTCK